jgi:hypothetical protein
MREGLMAVEQQQQVVVVAWLILHLHQRVG